MSKENDQNDQNNESTFPQRYLKKLPPDFIEAIEQMDSEDVKKRILTIEQHLYEIENSKLSDTKLQQAKEVVKDLNSVYSAPKNEENAKLKYCLYVLETRGVNISG